MYYSLLTVECTVGIWVLYIDQSGCQMFFSCTSKLKIKLVKSYEHIYLTYLLQSCMYHYFQGLLEGVSYSFTKNFNFIDSVKAYLSYALLRASVSQPPSIFQVLDLCFSFSSLHMRFWSLRWSSEFTFFYGLAVCNRNLLCTSVAV